MIATREALIKALEQLPPPWAVKEDHIKVYVKQSIYNFDPRFEHIVKPCRLLTFVKSERGDQWEIEITCSS